MPERPNILLIMCDQLSARVLGCYGGAAPTPNLDRLAAEGKVFDAAFCPTPFCSPSRASLITGLYPHAHGIVYNVNRRDYPAIETPASEEGLKRDDVTTERLLHAAGYRTHHFGKWHLTDDDLPYYADMYREHIEYARDMATCFAGTRRRPRASWMDWYGWALPVTVSQTVRETAARMAGTWTNAAYAEFLGKMGRLDLPVEHTFDRQVATRGVACLRARRGTPWMITCSFNMPHDPNVVPSPYYESISPDDIALPSNYARREVRFETQWSRQAARDFGEEGVREFLRIYYASVRMIDDLIGEVLHALEATGQAEETVVVFTADHGDMAGAHGMIWKSNTSFYEDVARVPLLVRYPTRVRPGRTDAPVNLTDLMPTLLQLAGHPVPEHVQGRSLAPLLLQGPGASDAPRYVFCERVRPDPGRRRGVAPDAPASFMVRGREAKYVRYDDGEEMLYDLRRDPGEMENLAADSGYADLKGEMVCALGEWLATTGFPTATSPKDSQ